jgi:hypothetical protein
MPEAELPCVTHLLLVVHGGSPEIEQSIKSKLPGPEQSRGLRGIPHYKSWRDACGLVPADQPPLHESEFNYLRQNCKSPLR